MTKAIMVQGGGSNVGKSLLVAGLCRHFARKGLRVRPFKPQNMSNNAAVTPDGGEIGRAQALQALAAGVAPSVDMNPVLLKPETDTGAQVVMRGQRIVTARARDYAALRPRLMAEVLGSFRRLARGADLVIVEGAGSPAEVNLRDGDIANMGFAEAADLPVVLVGDIDRGGVIAQLVGTHAVLGAADRARISAFVVNKFRGDPSLFDAGLAEIAARTGWRSLGVLPWFEDARRLPSEDALDIDTGPRTEGGIVIAVPRLGRIANFDDLDPLAAEPSVSVVMVQPGEPLPAEARLVILPGTKSTIADLQAFRENGWDIDLLAHVRRGGRVLGICGGYQMLGRRIADPDGVEGPPQTVDGLGLLDVETIMLADKTVRPVSGRDRNSGAAVLGYEIHAGRTEGPDCGRSWLEIEGRPEGASSRDGRVRGAYVHGIFASDDFRRAFLAELGAPESGLSYEHDVERTLDRLAAHLDAHMDTERFLALARSIPD
ncbi:MAG: cobyric acid synthase [Alphaproteobacteria bacterium]|nr:MAG: cobyric acid synthase [Alphaproteobacteria bacterium]